MARIAKNGDTKALHEKLYTTLRDQICLLDYPPGKLISENALAAEFNTSRSFVRRVLQRLEFEGLLTRQDGGVTVATYDIKFVREAYHLRIRFHDLITEEADPAGISDAQLTEMEELVRRQQELRSEVDLQEWGRINMAFHETYMDLVSNSLLRRFIDHLYYRAVRVWLRILPDLGWEQENDHMAQEMMEVINALRSGDVCRSAKIRQEHLRRFYGRLLNYLRGSENVPL